MFSGLLQKDLYKKFESEVDEKLFQTIIVTLVT